MDLGTEAERILDRPLEVPFIGYSQNSIPVNQGLLSQIETSSGTATYSSLTIDDIMNLAVAIDRPVRRVMPLIYGTGGRISDSDGNIIASTFPEGSSIQDSSGTTSTYTIHTGSVGARAFEDAMITGYWPHYSTDRYITVIDPYDFYGNQGHEGVDGSNEESKPEPFFLTRIKLKTNV
jgi:hypothetical protein